MHMGYFWDSSQLVPGMDNLFLEEFLSNLQSEPPLEQLEAVSSCSIICYLGADIDFPHHLGDKGTSILP